MGQDIDSQEIARQLLTEISNDTMLCTPVYLKEIETEHQVESWQDAPLVYLWNEDRQSGSFSLSVNGQLIEQRLEKLLSREHEQFELIRDGVINALAQTARNSIIATCEKLGSYPSEVFGRKK